MFDLGYPVAGYPVHIKFLSGAGLTDGCTDGVRGLHGGEPRGRGQRGAAPGATHPAGRRGRALPFGEDVPGPPHQTQPGHTNPRGRKHCPATGATGGAGPDSRGGPAAGPGHGDKGRSGDDNKDECGATSAQ